MADITFFGISLKPDNIWVWIESIAVTLSLPFLGYQLIQATKATKDQEAATRDSTYESLRSVHHDLISKQIDEPALMEVYNTVTSDNIQYFLSSDKILLKNEDEMKIFSFYLAEFDLYERVYDCIENKIIDEYEWVSWLIYLEKMSHHWLFQYTYNQTREIFDAKFMTEIKAIIDNKDDAAKKLKDRAVEAYKKDHKDKLSIPSEIKFNLS